MENINEVNCENQELLNLNESIANKFKIAPARMTEIKDNSYFARAYCFDHKIEINEGFLYTKKLAYVLIHEYAHLILYKYEKNTNHTMMFTLLFNVLKNMYYPEDKLNTYFKEYDLHEQNEIKDYELRIKTYNKLILRIGRYSDLDIIVNKCEMYSIMIHNRVVNKYLTMLNLIYSNHKLDKANKEITKLESEADRLETASIDSNKTINQLSVENRSLKNQIHSLHHKYIYGLLFSTTVFIILLALN